ncbi:MAG: L-glutamate gamma-semialdehyde dehydrogenase [Deltaproteobacteria bacterium]|nr:MAG: L-glutamate gamma-semialdehyde dehydrogenase [Deltaproteobacteria bacterium]
MIDGKTSVPLPENEPVLAYAPGSPERAALKAELDRQSAEVLEIPLWIGGAFEKTGEVHEVAMPHAHAEIIGRYHAGRAEHMGKAIEAALEAKQEWENWSFAERAAVFLRAAELLRSRRRMVLNASTMLGQSKTAHQAEIDSACELIDFFRFNVAFAERLLEEQPLSPTGTWNRMDYRPLDGFVLAVTPFNFTSIAGNLPTAPALMGNTVVWKPSLYAMHSAWQLVELLREAGLPDGVINMVTGDPAELVDAALSHPDFGGLHFTGSTKVLRTLFKTIGERIERYRQYPRVVGESGGKDFVFVHTSAEADLDAVAVALLRGAFEYQGQKCSAASRAYVPRSLWKPLSERLIGMMGELKMGDVRDFRNFLGAVIHRTAFERCRRYIDEAKASPQMQVLAGGGCDDRVGYFVEPTLLLTENPRVAPMCEEIFGPILTVYVYEDGRYEETLDECNRATEYGLTGAIFARDRRAIHTALGRLRHSAGNFYVNDKPTGAVVGQQPFGGSRASGTNDKAGSALNLLRWVSPRTIKETYDPPRDWRYPFLGEA